MYATDKCQTDRQTLDAHHRLMPNAPYPGGRGIISPRMGAAVLVPRFTVCGTPTYYAGIMPPPLIGLSGGIKRCFCPTLTSVCRVHRAEQDQN